MHALFSRTNSSHFLPQQDTGGLYRLAVGNQRSASHSLVQVSRRLRRLAQSGEQTTEYGVRSTGSVQHSAFGVQPTANSRRRTVDRLQRKADYRRQKAERRLASALRAWGFPQTSHFCSEQRIDNSRQTADDS